jgi:ribose 5-phosphate isomerase A
MGGAPQISPEQQKRLAAETALRLVEPGMTVGLGSGSTAAWFIRLLGERHARGALAGIRGIPTSEASRKQAETAGIPLTDFSSARRCDVTVDGADEIDPKLNLVKGLGGALLREKIVAQNSDRVVIIADGAKLVERLGSRTALPVEVIPFGAERQPDFLRECGGEPRQRLAKDGGPYETDGGNYIFDVAFGPIEDAPELEATLLRRAGVVQTGLFLGIAHEAIIAHPDRLQTMLRA